MLQRAASRAYSWWWASHIRAKQSKWLEMCIQDMEEKVDVMMGLIQGDGDTFAMRAEMYYKRRPELINAVEEVFMAFRGLADRYDFLSKEMRNANHTIGAVFPEQVQLQMAGEEDFPDYRNSKNAPKPAVKPPDDPQIPKAPERDLKRLMSAITKQFQGKKELKTQTSRKELEKSGLTKDEAMEEIKKLQKEILKNQTVKEFVQISYESGVTKYWEIENMIIEMQERVSKLQDEFDMTSAIEDHEARTLMAETALKSCHETLDELQEKQENLTRQAQEEYQKIEAACQQVKYLMKKYEVEEENRSEDNEPRESTGGVPSPYKARENLDSSSFSCLSVSHMAEKINGAVNKVINLESAMSSREALVKCLKTETNELNADLQALKDEEGNQTGDIKGRVKAVVDKLNMIKYLNMKVERQRDYFETEFSVARVSLDNLSEGLSSVKPDDDEDKDNADPDDSDESGSRTDDEEDVLEMDDNVYVSNSYKSKWAQIKEEIRKRNSLFLDVIPKADHYERVDEAVGEELKWQPMLLDGNEVPTEVLLEEYQKLLGNYKILKRKLGDIEEKERNDEFEITLHMTELKQGILKKDEENQHLRQKLKDLDMEIKEDSSPSPSSISLEGDDDDLCPNEGANNGLMRIFLDRAQSLSDVERKLRGNIDSVLDENLGFWLRFSSAFHEIQKFRTQVHDLQLEARALKEAKKAEGYDFTAETNSDARAIYKHLKEIDTELTHWLEQSVSMKDELESRFASLCSIQEEIMKALKESVAEDEIIFSSHQAAKFQGEVLNMKQENNKVREELEGGLKHVRTLQNEIEKTLEELNKEYAINKEHSDKSKSPMGSVLFGDKKKHKNPILTYMHPYRRYAMLKAGIRLRNHH